jgi:hypothetical protein
MMGDGYADDEIPLWVARPPDGAVQQVSSTDEQQLSPDESSSEVLSSDVVSSGVLLDAITPRRSTPTIPRYPGQQRTTEDNRGQQTTTQRTTDDNSVQQVLIIC